MTVFVRQRGLLHIGWIAGSQVHRTIAKSRVARPFEDHGVDVRLEVRQSGTSLQRVHDLRPLVGPQPAVRVRGLRKCLVLRSEGHADLSENRGDDHAREHAHMSHGSSRRRSIQGTMIKSRNSTQPTRTHIDQLLVGRSAPGAGASRDSAWAGARPGVASLRCAALDGREAIAEGSQGAGPDLAEHQPLISHGDAAQRQPEQPVEVLAGAQRLIEHPSPREHLAAYDHRRQRDGAALCHERVERRGRPTRWRTICR
jgi:hypothetical protein